MWSTMLSNVCLIAVLYDYHTHLVQNTSVEFPLQLVYWKSPHKNNSRVKSSRTRYEQIISEKKSHEVVTSHIFSMSNCHYLQDYRAQSVTQELIIHLLPYAESSHLIFCFWGIGHLWSSHWPHDQEQFKNFFRRKLAQELSRGCGCGCGYLLEKNLHLLVIHTDLSQLE